MIYFRLDANSGLCRLDSASTQVTRKCDDVECPYPTCACTEILCPSGALNSGLPTEVYPADDIKCCPVANTLLERLVLENHLDCTGGSFCAATTMTPTKGRRATDM
jgi:hypothetical protein